MAPLTVLCVRWGDKYPLSYVYRLKAAVARYLDVPHTFVCVTDQMIDGLWCRVLPSGLEGWWNKLAMFRRGFCPGDKLYFDLDVVVTGDLKVFLRPGTRSLWALDDFGYSLLTPRFFIDEGTRRLLGGNGTCNSSVMYWRDDCAADVWDRFNVEVSERLHGDQNHITQCLWPDRLSLYEPGLACSYKYHAQEGHRFGSVCVFHGDPKPEALPRLDPLRRTWETACAVS